MPAERFVRSLFLIAVFAATASSAEESLPTARSITLSAGQEQAAQPVILAARRYAAFWNTGEPRYAEAALARNFADRTLPSGRPQGVNGVLEASKNFRAAIPDLRAEIEELLVVEDRAVVRYLFTGHFIGKFKDLNVIEVVAQCGKRQVIDSAAARQTVGVGQDSLRV